MRRLKLLKRSDHSALSNAQVNNAWNFMSAHPYIHAWGDAHDDRKILPLLYEISTYNKHNN